MSAMKAFLGVQTITRFLADRMSTFSVLPLLLLLALPSEVNAQFLYLTNNGAITITGYTGSDQVVTIPGTMFVNGFNLPVTSIGSGAFWYNTNLYSIMIPAGVTNIGDSAFLDCMYLESATIPATVTSIGDSAFSGCIFIGSITIPNGVTTIGNRVFYDCAFLAGVTIPAGVTTIGNSAFYDCQHLTNITIPSSVTTIGSGAFESSGLTSVTVPASVTNIGIGAFAACSGLASISVEPGNSAYAGVDGILFNHVQTTLIQFPTAKATSSPSYAIPNSVTSIGDAAFGACHSLTNLAIPNGVTTIGDDAFFGTGLTLITLPESVTSIGSGAFDGSSLASITIPSGVTSISYDAFLGCANLTNVTIPSGVTSIGTSAFYLCRGLKRVCFQGNAPSFDTSAFEGDNDAIVCHLPGTTGWGPTFAGLPTAFWVLPNPVILNTAPSLGVQNNAFGFTISWATNAPVVVEACTNLAAPAWLPLQTNSLTAGSYHFSDPQWANYPARFYRIRSP